MSTFVIDGKITNRVKERPPARSPSSKRPPKTNRRSHARYGEGDIVVICLSTYDDALVEIDRRADEARMSRSEYMCRAALGLLTAGGA